MLRCGDEVLYGIHGVCRILTMEEKRVDGKLLCYYVLEPMEQPGTRYYVPSHNQAAVAKLSKLLSAEELNTLLESESIRSVRWICDEAQRKQKYRELINSGDRAALLSMIHALYRHKRLQAEAGRKLHLCDENFLRDAEKLIRAEFSLVLGIPQDRIGSYIAEKLK